MTLMKCPKCGREADAPDKIVDDGEICYHCEVPLVIASPEAAAQREKSKQNKLLNTAIGACVGMLFVFLMGMAGGAIGLAIVGAVGGAFLGLVVGSLRGLFDGAFYSLAFSDPSWFSFWIKASIAIFSILGFIAGLSGSLVEKNGQVPILIIGCMGGLCIGGMIGAVTAKERTAG